MQIRLLNDAQKIRTDFEDKFVMDWQKFQIVCKKYVKQWRIKEPVFHRFLMWDKMSPEYSNISFQDALALLRTVPGEVLFLSEGPDYPYPEICELRLGGQRYPYFVAATDARELADLIERDWMENICPNAEFCPVENPVLPQDLYAFTPEMDRLIVFTHETTKNYIHAAESRLCITFGFDQ